MSERKITDKDIISRINYIDMNQEDHVIYFAYSNGNAMPFIYDEETEEYVPYTLNWDDDIMVNLKLADEPKFQEVSDSGERIAEIDIEKFIPTLSEDNAEFQVILDDVMHVMQSVYPDANAEYIKTNLPTLAFDFVNEETQYAGAYSPMENSMVICESKYDSTDKLKVIFHESMHMASTKVNEKDDDYICGFNSAYGNGVGLNEGMTEYLTSNAVGTDGAYSLEIRFTKMLLAVGDRDEIINAYFRGDNSVIRDTFNDDEKAKKFITCVDIISGLDFDICSKFADKIKSIRTKLLKKKDVCEEDLDEDEDEKIWFEARDMAEEEAEEEEEFQYEYYDTTVISDAEQILLDEYEMKLEAFEQMGLEDLKIDLVREFKKSFITYKEVDNNDPKYIVDNGLLSSRFIDMIQLDEVSKRFEEINETYFDKDTLQQLDDEIVLEEQSPQIIYHEGESDEDFDWED